MRSEIQLFITRAEADLITKALKSYRPNQTCTLQDLVLNEARWAMEDQQRKETILNLISYIRSK